MIYESVKDIKLALIRSSQVDTRIQYIERSINALSGDILKIQSIKQFQEAMTEKIGQQDTKQVKQFERSLTNIDKGIHQLQMMKVEYYSEAIKLKTALYKLDHREIIAISGRYEKGLDYEEIAQNLDLSTSQVRKVTQEGMTKILEDLNSHQQFSLP